MKKLVMALCALMISGMSHAVIDSLSVRFYPDTNRFSDVVQAVAFAAGNDLPQP